MLPRLGGRVGRNDSTHGASAFNFAPISREMLRQKPGIGTRIALPLDARATASRWTSKRPPAPLADQGIDKHLAARARKAAAMPRDKFAASGVAAIERGAANRWSRWPRQRAGLSP